MFDYQKAQKLETRGASISTDLEEALAVRTAGVPVNDRTALSVPFIYRGVDILSSKIASLPRVICKDKAKLPQHPASRLLNVKCNSLYPCYTAIKTLVGHAVLQGNGYGVIMRTPDGRPDEMFIVNPRMTYLRYINDQFVYQVTVYVNSKGEIWSQPWIPSHEMAVGYTATTMLIPQEDMFHLRGLGDGLSGYSLLTLLSQAIGEQVALQEFSNSFFANGCSVGQALKVPSTAQLNWRDEVAVERFRRTVEGKHRGPANAFRLMLLLGGAELAGSVGLTAKEAQVVEQRQFGIKLISAILGIPCYLLDGTPEGASQYGTQEARSRDFLAYTVANWLDAFAAEAEAKLLTEEEKQTGDYHLCFDRDKLIELDVTTSRNVLWGDVKNGLKSEDEAREELGLPPMPKGDDEGQDVQAQALNGTQISSLLEVVNSIASGTVSAEAGKVLVSVCFPAISSATVANLVDAIEVKEPPPPPPPVAMMPPAAPSGHADAPPAVPQPDDQGDKLDAARTATATRLVTRFRKSVHRRKDLLSFLGDQFADYHRDVTRSALAPFTADADVIADDLLPSLAEELAATTRDQWDLIFERVKNDLSQC